MIHGLAPIRPAVNHDAVTVGQSFLIRDPFGRQQQMPHEGVVLGLGVRQFGDRLLGNNQNVNGCLGIDVAEGQAEIIFIDDRRRDLLADDFAKKGVVGITHTAVEPEIGLRFDGSLAL